jgi:hypothetical protein
MSARSLGCSSRLNHGPRESFWHPHRPSEDPAWMRLAKSSEIDAVSLSILIEASLSSTETGDVRMRRAWTPLRNARKVMKSSAYVADLRLEAKRLVTD